MKILEEREREREMKACLLVVLVVVVTVMVMVLVFRCCWWRVTVLQWFSLLAIFVTHIHILHDPFFFALSLFYYFFSLQKKKWLLLTHHSALYSLFISLLLSEPVFRASLVQNP